MTLGALRLARLEALEGLLSAVRGGEPPTYVLSAHLRGWADHLVRGDGFWPDSQVVVWLRGVADALVALENGPPARTPAGEVEEQPI